MREPNHTRQEYRPPQSMIFSAPKESGTRHPVFNAPSVQGTKRTPLSLEAAVDFVLLAGLTLTAQHLQPDFHRLTLFTGLVGGGLCVLWGVLGRRGTTCRGGMILFLTAAACVFARQVVQSWSASGSDGLLLRSPASFFYGAPSDGASAVV